MKFIILAIVVALAFAEMHPVNHNIVAEIKAKATTWTPMEPEENPFAYMPIEQIKAMMGTKLAVNEESAEDMGFEPNDEFDARKEWGSKVHAIRNQGQCGSCWAFGATEALSDRFAIEEGVDVVLSPQHLVSCDRGNFGCNGGYLNKAWDFMQKTGVMTDECYPYTSGTTGQDGDCKSTCADGSAPELYHSKKYTMTSNVKKTQQAIQKDGPIEAAFTVYQDFMSYKSGVYQHTSGGMLGGHAIKALGWGTEDGVDYWLMANSWDTTWGEDGFFKIKRGDCGINNQMTFGVADKVDKVTAETF
jgi:cathepsin B